MAIDWSKEPFSRLYKRETDDDLMLSWEAEAVWHKFLKKCDHTGLLETKHGVQGLARYLRIPLEVVERSLPELLEDGRLQSKPDSGFVAPNYVIANYAARSAGARQAAFRARQLIAGASVENDVNEASESVTPSNAESRDVTSGHENCQLNSTQLNSYVTPPAIDAGASKSRRHAIPEDWSPRPEERELARNLGLNCDKEAQEFLSFWLGDGRPKKNWHLTFRNRLQQIGNRKPAAQQALRQATPSDDAPPLWGLRGSK